MGDSGALMGFAKFGEGLLKGMDSARKRRLEEERLKQQAARSKQQDAIQTLREQRLLKQLEKENQPQGVVPLLDESGNIIPGRYKYSEKGGAAKDPFTEGIQYQVDEGTGVLDKSKFRYKKTPGKNLSDVEKERVKSQTEVDKARAQEIREGKAAPKLNPADEDLKYSQVGINTARIEEIRGKAPTGLLPKLDAQGRIIEGRFAPKPTPGPKPIDKTQQDYNSARAEEARARAKTVREGKGTNPKSEAEIAQGMGMQWQIDPATGKPIKDKYQYKSSTGLTPLEQLLKEDYEVVIDQDTQLPIGWKRRDKSKKEASKPNPMYGRKDFRPMMENGVVKKDAQGNDMFEPVPTPTPSPSPTPKPTPTPDPLADLKKRKLEAQVKGLEKPPVKKSGKGPKLPLSSEVEVRSLAGKQGNVRTVNNLLKSTLKLLRDPKIKEEQKIQKGMELLKVINSPMGADAIGAEESQRLGSFLEVVSTNRPGGYLGTGFKLGRDLPGFTEAVDLKTQELDSLLGMNQERINELEGRPTGLLGKKSSTSIPVGTIKPGKGGKKYRFKGGDSKDKNSWELVK